LPQEGSSLGLEPGQKEGKRMHRPHSEGEEKREEGEQFDQSTFPPEAGGGGDGLSSGTEKVGRRRTSLSDSDFNG